MNGGHSREKLIEILREDKFTEEQINYALKVCNPK
ncbi:MAG: Ltp family lipoprotein [Lachnospiraceae bacterium]|nr:Ltp family lipoprotein [Lachnospiraceae bacterium]